MALMNPRREMPISVSKITTKQQLPSSCGPPRPRPPSSSTGNGNVSHSTPAGNHRPNEKQGLLVHQSQNLDDGIQKPFHLQARAACSPTSTTPGAAGGKNHNANSSRPTICSYRVTDQPQGKISHLAGPPYTTNEKHPLILMPHKPPEMSEEDIIFEAIRMRDEADARHYQKKKLEQDAAAKKKRVQAVGTKETLQSHVPASVEKEQGEFIAPRNISNSKPVLAGYAMARTKKEREQNDPLLGRGSTRQLQGPEKKPPHHLSHHGQRRVASYDNNVPERPNRMAGQALQQLPEPQRYHKDAYIFATPPEFEAVDEKEKERRHQSLAVEQQDLILQRVRASRAKKAGHRHQKPTHARRTS